MIFKSYILEKDLKIINNHSVFLFYGENHGLKKDFKENLKELNKNNEVINLFQSDVIKNKNILINEISNKSLFNEKKVIFIDEINDKILEILEEVINHVEKENIFLFADILDKKSKIRDYFEKSKKIGITACYQDNAITIRNIISNKLNSYKGLNNEIINLIADHKKSFKPRDQFYDLITVIENLPIWKDHLSKSQFRTYWRFIGNIRNNTLHDGLNEPSFDEIMLFHLYLFDKGLLRDLIQFAYAEEF